jgi:hypothetical protein
MSATLAAGCYAGEAKALERQNVELVQERNHD